MIGTYLIIRLKQLYRAVAGIGLIRALILAVLLFLIALGIFIHSEKTPNVYVVNGLTVFMMFFFHLKRKDKRFLRSRFDNYRLIIWIEYVIYASPVIFCSLYFSQLISALVLLSCISIISQIHIRSKYKRINTVIQRIIPADSFEWKAGSRKIMYYILPLWLAGFAGSFFVGTIPFVILVTAMIPLGFYDKGEPYQMIIAGELSSNNFLRLKIKRQLQIFSILSIPLIICFTVFHIQYWYITLIEYVFFIILHIYFILAKYAFYEPNMKSSTAQLYGAFGALSLFVPFLFPFVWIMSVYFYFKAKKKLNFYLNDFN
jgi:hypothetical protein